MVLDAIFLKKCSCLSLKLDSVIGYHVVRQSVPSEDVFFQELSHLLAVMLEKDSASTPFKK